MFNLAQEKKKNGQVGDDDDDGKKEGQTQTEKIWKANIS